MNILTTVWSFIVCHCVAFASVAWRFLADNYIGIATVIGIVIALCSYRFQRRKPVVRAVAIVNGDWATATITVTTAPAIIAKKPMMTSTRKNMYFSLRASERTFFSVCSSIASNIAIMNQKL